MLYIDPMNAMIFTYQLKLFPFYLPVPDEKTAKDPPSVWEGSRKLLTYWNFIQGYKHVVQ